MPPPRIFFTHVMKTGGTSLHRVVKSMFPADTTYPPDEARPGQASAKTFAHLLLDMEPAKRDAIRYFSVHQPAWVSFAVAPDAVRITILREPVARAVSHLRQLRRSANTPDDLEAIYDDRGWRDRLVNHQTQLFADPGPAPGSDAPPLDAEELTDDDIREIQRGMIQFWETGISRPRAIGPTEFDAAVSTLERYDCVGITEDLPGMARRVSALTGLDLPAVSHDNAGDRADSVSAELLDRIRADNRYDIELYEHARRLASRPCPRG